MKEQPVIVKAPAAERWEGFDRYPAPIAVGDVKIEVPWDIRCQILAAVRAVNGEIAGWAEADVNMQTGRIRLTKIGIPEQEASGGDAEVEAEQTFELAKLGELDLTRAIVSWHSHPGGGQPTPSGIDDRLYRKLGDMMPVFVGIVTNKEGLWHAEVWLKTPMGSVKMLAPVLAEYPLVPNVAEVAALAKERCKSRYQNYHRHRDGKFAGMGQQIPLLLPGAARWEHIGASAFIYNGEQLCALTACHTRAGWTIEFDVDPTAIWRFCHGDMVKLRDQLLRAEQKVESEWKKRGALKADVPTAGNVSRTLRLRAIN